MRMLKYTIALALVAMVGSGQLLAQEVDPAEQGIVTATLKWQHASTRENGAVLPLDQIQGYQIEAFNNGAIVDTWVVERTEDGTLPQQFKHDIVYPIAATKVTMNYKIRTLDTFGSYSRWSEPVAYSAVVGPVDYSNPTAPPLSIGVQCTDCTLLQRR